MTGLKINYHKREVFVFGYSQLDKERLANMLNCALGVLPFKYLGIPISDHHLGMGAFGPIFQKMCRRLDPWKGKHLTSGGDKFLLILALAVSLFTSWVSIG